MLNAGLALDESICILEPDDSPYCSSDWLISQMKRMTALPDAFICANDYLAVHLMKALRKMGKSIPDDIMVTGFDGIPQSTLVEPALTTVKIPGIEIGRISADILLNRIRNPELPFIWVHVRTNPVWRKSTREG